MEASLVNDEFINKKETYNITNGGKGGYKHLQNKVTTKDKNGNILYLSTSDIRYTSGEVVGISKGTVIVKDSNSNTYRVSVNDPRYISGELVHVSSGTKHSEESKQKMRLVGVGKNSGSKNPMFGSIWIYNNSLKESKSIKKEDLTDWLSKGWLKGRKLKFD